MYVTGELFHKVFANSAPRELVLISQGMLLVTMLCILYVDTHDTQCNKQNNHAILFLNGKVYNIAQGDRSLYYTE